MKIFIFLIFLILSFAFYQKNGTYSTTTAVEVDLFIKDHKFEPSVLELPSNRKIRITVHNQDPTIEEFESFDLKREKIILGNSKSVITLAPLKSGQYKFFGEFHEDTATGKIIVKDTDILPDTKGKPNV